MTNKEKKPTRAQIESKIKNAVVFIPRDKEYKSIYFTTPTYLTLTHRKVYRARIFTRTDLLKSLTKMIAQSMMGTLSQS